MTINQYLWTMVAMAVLFLGSCKKDDPVDMNVQAVFQTEAPEGISNFKIKELTIVAKEVNTGKESEYKGADETITLQLESGVYDIQVNGLATYELDGATVETSIAASVERRQITQEQNEIALPLFLVTTNGGFVIEEVFFSGNNTPENELYLGDRYIKIYNNSNEVLYADGLAIATTTFMTIERYEYTPNIMNEAVAVDAIMVIPGNGTDYAVQPGGSIIIAETAIDHKEFNGRAINLSESDFEMLDPDDDEDVDNPAVPNMVNLLEKVVMHNRGFHSYVLARIPVNKETYLSDYVYDYSYEYVFEDFSMDMEESTYKIPNDWIIDAVNLSVQSDFLWIVTAPTLDKGWTYCGKFDGDESRFGKSVKRKVLSTSASGHPILKDTNDSSVDFEAEATPSLKN